MVIWSDALMLLIAFIPKSNGAIDLKSFRPISITSSACKMEVKVLDGRLKRVIGKLVSDHQNAFIINRQITDASLNANEVLDWTLRSGKSGILGELDAEKTFEQLN